MYGYHGRYLRIDAATGAADAVPLAEEVLRCYLGGVGLAVWLLHRECPRGVDSKELDECLESIKTESCNNPIDTISRLAACRTSDLCLKSDTPNR